MVKKRMAIHPFRMLSLVAAVLLLWQAHAWGVGLSWGPIVDTSPVASCTPEDSAPIEQGPVKSPMRMAEYRQGSFLLSDRSGSVYEVSKSDPQHPLLLFQVVGKPLGIAVEGRTILVGNETSGKIERYTLRRNQFRKISSIPKSRGAKIQALDIEVDRALGMIFVVDGLGGDVKVYGRRGRLALSIGGFGQLTRPQALTLDRDAEEVLVTDYGDQGLGVSASVQVFDYSGRHLKTIRGAFSRPQGVWSAGQSIYLVDAMLGQVLEFDRDSGALLSRSGCYGVSDGHLRLPMDVLFDALAKQFWVADNRNGRISVLPVTEP